MMSVTFETFLSAQSTPSYSRTKSLVRLDIYNRGRSERVREVGVLPHARYASLWTALMRGFRLTMF